MKVGSGEYVEDDLDGNTGLPDGLAHFRVSLDEPLADICRLLGPSQYFAKVNSILASSLFYAEHCTDCNSELS